jgi:hypothetical protein
MPRVFTDKDRKVKAVPEQPTVNMTGVSAARKIRHAVTLGQQYNVINYIEWNRTESSYSAGSSAEVSMRLNGQSVDLFDMAQQKAKDGAGMRVDIATALDDGPFKSEFSGIADTITYDYNAGTITVAAMSFAQILLNAKITVNAIRRTSGEFVQELVKTYGCGMKSSVDLAAFKTPIGKVFHTENAVRSIMNMRVWDVIESLALVDGADLYVIGDTLYYRQRDPKHKAADILTLGRTVADFTYEWGKNILKLNVAQSPTFAHDVQVTVRSYSPRDGSIFTGTYDRQKMEVDAMAAGMEIDGGKAQAIKAKAVAKIGPRKTKQPKKFVSSGQILSQKIKNREQYVFTVPNASQADCDRIAAQIAKDIARHEFVVNIDVLAQPDLNARQFINLKGTGTKADQVYTIKSLTVSSRPPSEGSTEGGYTASMTMVNHYIRTVGENLGAQ